jgi:D-alanine-D-alanine ligase-like ATP-grasp enzyme
MRDNNGFTNDQIENIYHQMKKIFAHMMKCCENKFENRYGIFELMGCDILIDDTYKPYLLEMNTNPALFTDTST